MKAFTDLLSDANEEIQRSFIVALFFLEPRPTTITAASKENSSNSSREDLGLRSKPFFWPDQEGSISGPVDFEAEPIADVADPDQSRLVTEALQQGKNLIQYWLPGRGNQVIHWSEKHILNPDQGTPYFITAFTALPMLEPKSSKSTKSYLMMAQEVVSDHLPHNQPVFKVFTGLDPLDRKVFDAQGNKVPFTDTALAWSTEPLDNNDFIRLAGKLHVYRNHPFAAIKLDSGPYLTGSISQMGILLENRQDYFMETIIVKAKGSTNFAGRSGQRNRPLSTNEMKNIETWLKHTYSIATGVFGWLPEKQDQLFIQSSLRGVNFKKRGSSVEIDTSAMVEWESLPTNEELLAKRTQIITPSFLMEADSGYFFIPTDELEQLQENADEEVKVHTFILSAKDEYRHEWVTGSVRKVFQGRSLDCESIRVLSVGQIELAYSPQCSLIPTASGWEIAQADEQTQLKKAQASNQPLVIFRPEDKPPSAVPLRTLVDATRETIEGLKINTLVPVYALEDLDAEEIDDGIETGVFDALSRSLQFFPNQHAFEVLMPKGIREESSLQYTNIPPANFQLKHVYDKIDVQVPNSGGKVTTFYSIREGTVGTATEQRSSLEIPASDVFTSSGELNKSRILELAKDFHQGTKPKRPTPYVIIQSNQGKFYTGFLAELKRSFSKEESKEEVPKSLVAMVTHTKGVNMRIHYRVTTEVSWVRSASQTVLEYAQGLGITAGSFATVWSSTGQRHAAVNPDGTLRLSEMIQWIQRPSNKTLKAIRETWQGDMLLIHLPQEGYFLVQSGDGAFLLQNYPQAYIDTMVLVFGHGKPLATIKAQVEDIINKLPVDYSIRILSSFGTPIEERNDVSFYDGIDIALKLDKQGLVKIDLERSGLELAGQPREEVLTYAEGIDSPLAVLEWPSGNKSVVFFVHIKEALQDVTEIKAQQIVPSYDLAGIADEVDQEDKEDIISIALQDTLQRTLSFLPNQDSFEIVMPNEAIPRHYTKEPPPKNQIQSGPLGVIEIIRQSDQEKIKYYYKPSTVNSSQGNNALGLTP